jgi:hypothetical protein
MIVSKHVVNIYLMQNSNQNLPLSKEEGICQRSMSILTNKMPNLTEYAKVVILSKLEEGWSIRRVIQYYNIAKSTV